jgi:diacylglycerol kinase (ATP)
MHGSGEREPDRRRGEPMPSNINRGPRQIWLALIWSLKGLREGWRIEASFRLEVVLFVILFPLGLWLGDGAMEKALLAGSLLPVLAAEMLNSGLECVIDKLWPELHPIAGRAKDMGSAAVFLLMLNFLVIWIVILGARSGAW